MAGEDTSPVEPSKTHIRAGRGGVGNYQEAQKWKNVIGDEPPPQTQIEPLDHVNGVHSTGRGGSGNFRQGPDETSTERERRLSTRAADFDGLSAGRGGAGNIEAAKFLHRKTLEEERARRDAEAAEQARAQAQAAVDAIQFPKPTRTH